MLKTNHIARFIYVDALLEKNNALKRKSFQLWFYDELIISYQSIKAHVWAEILLFDKKNQTHLHGRKFMKI